MEQPKISYATERKKYYRRRHYHVCVLSTTETREREKDWNESTCKANVWATFYAADDSARSASENRQSNDVNKYSSSIRPLPNPAAPPHTHTLSQPKEQATKKMNKNKSQTVTFRMSFFLFVDGLWIFQAYANGWVGSVCLCVLRMVWTMCERCRKCGIRNRRRPEKSPRKKEKQ